MSNRQAAAVKPSRRSTDAPRKPTNITLPADLIVECRALGLNLSQICEASLRARLRQERDRRWRATHAVFLAAHNEQVEEEGLPLAVFQAF